ncbi:MAG TPA: CGNR zinc finger domain-containing protein [Gaiellaceae bacterium]|jgi:predicted RNA-binding Zn ribbon-like protein|nr:CGNR zinc finger domain-containing protein [Gaiellaceae bacterium]
MDPEAAPGDLEVVRAFVNTFDVETERDALSSPRALDAWLRTHGLLRRGAASRRDLEVARTLREAIRALLLENNGSSVRKEAARTIDRAAAQAVLTLRFDPSGAPRLEPAAKGLPGALGGILAIVAKAMADGTWSRLKACRAADCRWAFYDRARNHSRHWCSMEVCGNRTKARAYRARHGAAR